MKRPMGISKAMNTAAKANQKAHPALKMTDSQNIKMPINKTA